ncbi:MAG: hypothetical protein BJ554DRAFT_4180, partial [Olpidium bornovanus]
RDRDRDEDDTEQERFFDLRAAGEREADGELARSGDRAERLNFAYLFQGSRTCGGCCEVHRSRGFGTCGYRGVATAAIERGRGCGRDSDSDYGGRDYGSCLCSTCLFEEHGLGAEKSTQAARTMFAGGSVVRVRGQGAVAPWRAGADTPAEVAVDALPPGIAAVAAELAALKAQLAARRPPQALPLGLAASAPGAVQRAEENDEMGADDKEFGLVAASWQKCMASPVAVAEVFADGILNVVLDEEALARLKKRAPKYCCISRRFNLTLPDTLYQKLPEILGGIQHTVRVEERLMRIFARLKALGDANRLSADEQAFFLADWNKTQAHLHAALLLQGHQCHDVVDAYCISILQNLKMDQRHCASYTTSPATVPSPFLTKTKGRKSWRAAPI